MKRISKLCLLVGCLTVLAKSATYYVATTGNDANSGSMAQPFRTVAKACTAMVAGDTLLIRGGTYPGIDANTQRIPTGTSWTNAPVIRAFPNETVVMQNGWTVLNLPHAYIQYLSFENLVLDGLNTAQYVISAGTSGAHHIQFKNCEVKNAALVLVSINGHHHVFTGGHYHHSGNNQLFPTKKHYGFYVSGKDMLFENFELDHTDHFGIHNYNEAGGADRNVYRNLVIHHTSLVYGAGAGIIVSRGDQALLYNNIFYNNTGHGIVIGVEGTNAQVYNNTVYGGAQTGIAVDSRATNTNVRNNIAFANATVQILNSGAGTILSNNLTTNPRFVNAAAFDFKLLSGSPAIDSGVNLSSAGVIKDFAGTNRPQGPAFDIGAYEYVAAPVIRPGRAGDGEESGAITIRPAGSGSLIRWNGHPNATLEVYTLAGKKVALINYMGPAGAIWDAKQSPSGIYLVRVKTGNTVQTTKAFYEN